jgi:hypothetical protein
MLKHATVSFLAASWLTLTACSGDSDKPERSPDTPPRGEETRVIFNPSAGQIPVPNDLLFARQAASEEGADGTMLAGSDPTNPVVTGIDALDGNSVLSPIDIKFSGSLDTNQTLDAASFAAMGSSVVPNPNQNVFLLPLSFPSGDPLDQAAVDFDGDGATTPVEVPTFAKAAAYQQAVATQNQAALMALATPTARAEIISLDGGINNVIRITPLEPLEPETKYLVVVTDEIQDASGYNVYPSHAYNFIRDPDSPFDADDATVNSLRKLRSAITSWEQLATGYFGFMQRVYDAAGIEATAPTGEDIVFSLTFTTGGTDAILKSIAAPETFIEKNLRSQYRKDAISKLVNGTYNLSGDNSGQTNATDGAINSTINVLLTSPQLPDGSPNPLYNEAIANAIAGGADYATLAADASAAHVMQRSAAEAAIRVHETDGTDIATEAVGTVIALAGGDPAQVPAAFPSPMPRATSFFRVDPASEINPALIAPAFVYQGQITLPRYQPVPAGGDGSAITTTSWTAATLGNGALTPPSDKVTYRFPFPEKQVDVTVPVLATLPDEQTLGALGITKPAEGWPVVIFVHGINTDRSASLPLANALAAACVNPDTGEQTAAPCFATVAIDQPLHGVAPAGSTVPGLVSVTDPDSTLAPNLPGSPAADLTERHFDFTADAQANPVPMDYAAEIGASGSLFINLSNFTNVRSNLQQMVLDLLNLNASLGGMDVDGDGSADDIDASRVYFIGYSLGGINGTSFIAVNNDPAVQASPFNQLPKIQSAALLKTGGGIPRLLTNSPSIAPRVLQGLAGASDALTQGNSGLETYLNVFQGILDSVDAVNFAADLADANGSTGVLLTEIVGDGTAQNPPDLVVPNAADTLWGENKGPLDMVLENGFVIDSFPAPLSGTEPLAAQFGAVPTAQATSDGDPAVLITRFTEGSHSTPVTAGNTAADPLTSGAVFMEIVQQIATFFAFNGDVPGSIVTNESVVVTEE